MSEKVIVKGPKNNNKFRNIVSVATVLYIVLPFIPILIWSFALRWNFPNLLPEFSLRSWKYVFAQQEISNALGISLVLSLVVTFASLLIGFPAGRALGMYEFKGKRVVEVLMLLPAIIPVLAVVMGMQVIFIRLGLNGTFWGVVIVQLIPTMPYMVLNLQSVFRDYSIEIEQQARILGAGPLKTMVIVTIPKIFPGVVVACLYTFNVSWAQYLLTVMIGGASVRTLPTLLFSYLQSGDYAMAGTVSIVFIAPALMILALTSRYLSGKKER
jgi:putative spermidine/putrescine transport system permease protein